jgi:hypothetical protein
MHPFRTRKPPSTVASAEENPAKEPKADARTRTGDPFITSDEPVSAPVRSSHSGPLFRALSTGLERTGGDWRRQPGGRLVDVRDVAKLETARPERCPVTTTQWSRKPLSVIRRIEASNPSPPLPGRLSAQAANLEHDAALIKPLTPRRRGNPPARADARAALANGRPACGRCSQGGTRSSSG